MKKLVYYLLIILSTLLLSSCQKEPDSLMQVSWQIEKSPGYELWGYDKQSTYNYTLSEYISCFRGQLAKRGFDVSCDYIGNIIGLNDINEGEALAKSAMDEVISIYNGRRLFTYDGSQKVTFHVKIALYKGGAAPLASRTVCSVTFY